MTEVRIRAAGLDDARGVADVHVQAWRSAYAGLIDPRVLDDLSVEKRTEGWRHWISLALADPDAGSPTSDIHRLLVAESGGRIVGWASFGAGRDEGEAHRGELAGLYLHPEVWSRGIGRTVMLRVMHELESQGFESAYLWVLDGNERAIQFYEKMGWLGDGGVKIGEAGGATRLRELRHSRDLQGVTRS